MGAKRVLVVGSTGFAGGHFVAAAKAAGLEVVTAARTHGEADFTCDLLDVESMTRALAELRPDAVVNLAGAASVGRSWAEPAGAFEVNAAGVLNLLEAAAKVSPEAHILCVSSGEVYGVADDAQLPLREAHPMRPSNPYATSKAAMELVCGQYSRSAGLRIAAMRAFNHVGPGQSDAFAASSFARQIATAEAEGHDRVEVHVGDLSPERDISDVRDVVRAYVLAVEHDLTGVYNVCSGRPVKLATLVDELAGQSRVDVEVTVDESRLRPGEAACVFGSSDRLHESTGWVIETDLGRTLGDLLDWWRERLTP